jgi:hypothetical protein
MPTSHARPAAQLSASGLQGIVHANTVPNSSQTPPLAHESPAVVQVRRHAPLQTRPDAQPVPLGQAAPSANPLPPELVPPEVLPELLVPLEEPVPELVPELVPEEEAPDEEPELEEPDELPDDVPPDDPPSGVRSPIPTIVLHAEAPAMIPIPHTTTSDRRIRTSPASRNPRPSAPPAPSPTAR